MDTQDRGMGSPETPKKAEALTSGEAQQRLAQYGENAIHE
jgi:hypothetical protein